jgi:CotS family spore coat protein
MHPFELIKKVMPMYKRQKSSRPQWLDEFIQEMMKPPHFLKNQPPSRSAFRQSVEYTPPVADERQSKREDAQSTEPKSEDRTRVSSPSSPPAPSAWRKGYGMTVASTTASTQQIMAWAEKSLQNYYAWNVLQSEPYANVLKVTTSDGVFALKRTHISMDRVRFIHRAQQYAKKQGFDAYAPFALTKKKVPGVFHEGNTYYATPWVVGQPVNFSSVEQVGQSAYTLARFHEATRGFESTGYNPDGVFSLLKMHQERHRDLKQLFYRIEAKRTRDDFDESFLALKESMLNDAEESLQFLQKRDIEAFLAEDEQRPGLCHLDVIAGNLMYDKEHRVQLIDFDLATYAPRALDIAHLLRRSLQVVNWHPDTAYTCFVHYNTIKTMPKVEYALVSALLRFPYRAWRLAHTRYRFFSDDAQIHDILTYQEEETKRNKFLDEFANQVDQL